MSSCAFVRMRAIKLWLAAKSQPLWLGLLSLASRHVFAAMPPNDWENEAMWFQGHIDDWYNRSGRTIVKLGAFFPERPTSHTKNVTKQKFEYPFIWVTKRDPKSPSDPF